MTNDGRSDAQRNQYNVAGVQVANPQQKGDISVGGSAVDPTGRAIAVNLSSASVPNGYVLSIDSSAETNLAWTPQAASVSGDPNKLAKFDANGDITSSDLLDDDGSSLTLTSSKPSVIVSRSDGTSSVSVIAGSAGTDDVGVFSEMSSTATNNRLALGGALLSQRQSNFRNVSPISGIYVRGLSSNGLPTNNHVLSRHAIAYFHNNGVPSTTAVGQVVVLPSLSADQRDNLNKGLLDEFNALNAANPSSISPHNNSAVAEAFLDNGIFYCQDDGAYYVLKLQDPDPAPQKLLTQGDLTGNYATIKESSMNLVVGAKQTVDVELNNLFNFGEVMKITTESNLEPNPTVTTPSIILTVQFYSGTQRTAAQFVDSVELIVAPSGVTSAYPSITIDDLTLSDTAHLRVTNTSSATCDATITMKGIGTP